MSGSEMTMREAPFAAEIRLWSNTGRLIAWINDWLAAHDWQMSPSRGYDFLADLLRKLQDDEVAPTTEPIFGFLIERLDTRAAELRGSETDVALAMEMEVWRDRAAPIPGGIRSILQIYDWFLPLMRRLEGLTVLMTSERSPGRENVTAGEAVNWVFQIADFCFKDRHFQGRTPYGWPDPFEWVEFVRDELYEWKKKFKDAGPVLGAPPPNTAFSHPFG